MNAETVFSFALLLVSIAPVIILGIVQYKSKKPVGFWSGEEPPGKEQITDMEAYNRKHGMMWILYGTGFILCFVCGFPFGGEIAAALCMLEGIGGIFGLVAYHNKLNRMYRKKEGDI